MNQAINISVDPEAIKEARAAIVEILQLPNLDQETKRFALATLSDICEIKNVTISGNTIYGATGAPQEGE